MVNELVKLDVTFYDGTAFIKSRIVIHIYLEQELVVLVGLYRIDHLGALRGCAQSPVAVFSAHVYNNRMVGDVKPPLAHLTITLVNITWVSMI